MKPHLLAAALVFSLAACQPNNEPATQATATETTTETTAAEDAKIAAAAEQAFDLPYDGEIPLREETELAPGTPKRITGTLKTVEFKRISRDSRCPKEDECGPNGQIEVDLEVASQAGTQQIKLTRRPVVVDDLVFVLRDLVPRPSTEPTATLPTLHMVVDKSSVRYENSVIEGVSQDPIYDPKVIAEAVEKAKLKIDADEKAASTPTPKKEETKQPSP